MVATTDVHITDTLDGTDARSFLRRIDPSLLLSIIVPSLVPTGDEHRTVLELHAPDASPYYIGVFLVGAYQETLGELHNLFGDTDAVHVRVYEDGSYSVDHVVEGDSVEDVLAYVQFDRRMLTERVRRAVEAALREGKITLEESALLRRRYGQSLSGYTYLDQRS